MIAEFKLTKTVKTGQVRSIHKLVLYWKIFGVWEDALKEGLIFFYRKGLKYFCNRGYDASQGIKDGPHGVRSESYLNVIEFEN